VKLACVEPTLDSLDALEGIDAFCLLVASDERPLSGATGYLDWRLLGGLSRVLLDGFFKGDKGEKLLIPTAGKVPPVKAFAVGVGPSAGLNVAVLQEVLEDAAQVLKKAGVGSVALSLPDAPAVSDAGRAEAVKSKFAPAFGGQVILLADKSVKQALEK
jgi:hypothetical protein